MVEAQVENSLSLGWKREDLLLVSNIPFLMPIPIIKLELQKTCLTGSKLFALERLFETGLIGEADVWWVHDLDAWQNYPFEAPEFADIGLTEYSVPKFNGGSIFVRGSSKDLVKAVTRHILVGGMQKEEPALNSVLRSPEYKNRVTVLNSTYNVGCSAYEIRYTRSIKPILVSHFHPTNRLAWGTHVLGHNRLGVVSIPERLRQLLDHFFISESNRLPTHLCGDLGSEP